MQAGSGVGMGKERVLLSKQYNPEFKFVNRKFRLTPEVRFFLKVIRLVFHGPCPGKAGTVWGLGGPYRERLTKQGPRFGFPG